jgi:hypothetical protein
MLIRRIVWSVSSTIAIAHPLHCKQAKGEQKGKGTSHALKVTKVLYFTYSCGGGTPGAILMKFGSLVHMINVIYFAKFDHCNFNSLNLARV